MLRDDNSCYLDAFSIFPHKSHLASHYVQQFIFRITNDLLIYSVEEKTSIKYLLVHMNFDF